jgi:chromosome segregation ATPase
MTFRMNTRRIALWITAWLLLPLAAQENPVARLNRQAYLALEDGKAQLESENPAAALELFTESRKLYGELQALDPEFNAVLIEKRMEELDAEIARLQETLPAESVADASSPGSSGGDDYEQLYLQAREKIAREASRVLELEKRHLDTVIQLREANKTLREQQRELATLKQESMKMRGETGQELAELRRQVRDMARFNELLQEKTDRMEADVATQEEEKTRLKEELAGLRELETVLKADLEKARQQVRAAQSQSNTAEQRLILQRNQLQDDLQSANRDLASAQEEVGKLSTKLEGLALLEDSVVVMEERDQENRARIAALEQQVQTALQEKTAAEETLAAQQAKVGELETQTQAQEQAVLQKDQRIQELEAELAALKENSGKLPELQEQLARQENELASTRAALKESRIENTTLTQTISFLEEEKKRLAEELADSEKERARMTAGFEEAEKVKWESRESVKELRGEVKELQRSLRDEQATASRLQTVNTRLKEELSSAQLNLDQNRDARARLEKTAQQQLASIADQLNEINRLRNELNEKTDRIQELESAASAPQD